MTIKAEVKQFIERNVFIPDQFLMRAVEIVWRMEFKGSSGSHTIEQFKDALPAQIKAFEGKNSRDELSILYSPLYIQRYTDMVETALFSNQYIVNIFEYHYCRLEENGADSYKCMMLVYKMIWEVGIKEARTWEAGVQKAEEYFRHLASLHSKTMESPKEERAPSAEAYDFSEDGVATIGCQSRAQPQDDTKVFDWLMSY